MRWIVMLFTVGCLHPGAHKWTPGIKSVQVPLVRPKTDAHRWYIPVQIEDEIWLFFVDTGYSSTACDDSLVQSLGLKPQGRVPIRGELGMLIAQKARLPTLFIGDHQIEDLVCVVRDLNATSSITDSPEVKIGGVLAMDVLEHFKITVNPAKGELEFSPSSRTYPKQSVKLKRQGLFSKRYLFPLEINGEVVWPLLDTGANKTHIDAKHISLEPVRTVQALVRGTGNKPQSTRTVSTFEAELKLGDQVFKDHEFNGRHRSGGLDGLLGLDLLDQTLQVYDFPNSRVWLQTVDSFHRWSIEEIQSTAVRFSRRGQKRQDPPSETY